jgi:hypothetical protein
MRSAPPPTRAELSVLGACAVVMVLHQATRWGWTIDDAAICYAYARNLATGEGLVPWPGGERIEAISDPTWVALLAVLYRLGLDGFAAAKPLAMALGVGTLWLVWRLAGRALRDLGHRGPGALIAPMALCTSAQFAIWSASGLENSLFCLLLAAAIHRTVRELDAEHPGFPASAVLWLLLCWTRPEGVLYAAVGAAVYAAGTRAHGLRPTAAFAATLAVPLALSEVARIAYFAWPLPNTFYAKIASRGVAPLDWDSRGWWQLRDWADRLWHGYFAPLYVLGLAGADRRRAAVGLAVAGALALALLWPGTEALRAWRLWPDLAAPDAWVKLRLLAFVAAGLALPLLARGAPVRLLCGGSVVAGLAFSLVANGDWMGAYRFMSLVAPCLAVLFAVGLTVVLDALAAPSREWGPASWLGFAFGVGLAVPPNLSQTRDHAGWNKNETTASVKQRVDHTEAVRRRTFWEEPVTNLDVDQGAHLWWVPDRVEIDMAMLVDIPMARHWYQQRDFIREHVFTEHSPTFAHVGGWWAQHSGLRRYDAFEERYFELPPYVDLRFDAPFPNVFARRDLVVAGPGPPAPPDRVVFDWDIALDGVRQPAPWTAGQPGYLEAPFVILAPRAPGTEVEVVAFLARDGRVAASFDLPMGYGLLPMHEWRPGEVFRGRHAVPLPDGLPPGRYDLGFLLRGPRGYVIPAEVLPAGALTDPPVYARGEVRLPGAIELVDAAAHRARTDAARAATLDAAERGACAAAEEAWVVLKRHRPTDEAWHAAERPAAARALADCWAGRASAAADPVDALARAHRWDHWSPVLRDAGAPVAARLLEEGRRARAEEDWDTAYRRFADLLRFQPWRAWARRWAEEARDHRLGLTDDVRIGIGGEDNLRAWEEATGGRAE